MKNIPIICGFKFPVGRIACALLASVAVFADDSSPASTEQKIVITQNGATDFKIFVGDKADPASKFAASEFKRCIEAATKAEFELIETGDAPAGKLIVIGRSNPIVDSMSDTLKLDALGEEGFVIDSHSKDRIIITGREPRGTLYGVYGFLDKYCNCRWFAPWAEVIPECPKLEIPITVERQVPRFSYRESFYHHSDDELFCARNGLNGRLGHRSSKATDARLGGFIKILGSVHCFSEIMEGKAFCPSDPAQREFFAKIRISQIKYASAYAKHLHAVGQDDNCNYCCCPKCQEIIDREGSPSGPIFEFYRFLAGKAQEKVPGSKLLCLSYQYSQKPPQSMPLPGNIVVLLTDIARDYSVPIKNSESGASLDFKNDLEGWTKTAEHIYIWTYITNFGGFLQPHPNIDTMCEDIKYLASFPQVDGWFGQGNSQGSGGEFAELRTWLAAKMLWNPDQDYNKLIKEFIDGYYGKAAPFILEYLNILRQSRIDTKSKLNFRMPVTAPFLTFDLLQRAEGILDKAEAASGESAAILSRVQRVRLGIDYVILLRWPEFIKEASAKGISLGDRKVRLDRFRRNAMTLGVTMFKESGELKGILESMAVEREIPDAPDFCKNLPADQWREYQDLGLRMESCANTVADSAASDGAAAMMKGDHTVWGIQMKLDELPQEGEWKLYLAVRADSETAADACMFNAGIYPGGGNMSPTAKKISGKNYVWLEVPGAYKGDAGRSFWLAPSGNDKVKGIFLDRIVAVRVDKK